MCENFAGLKDTEKQPGSSTQESFSQSYSVSILMQPCTIIQPRIIIYFHSKCNPVLLFNPVPLLGTFFLFCLIITNLVYCEF